MEWQFEDEAVVMYSRGEARPVEASPAVYSRTSRNRRGPDGVEECSEQMSSEEEEWPVLGWAEFGRGETTAEIRGEE